VARQARPVAEQLIPAIERFLADPRGDILYRGEDGDISPSVARSPKSGTSSCAATPEGRRPPPPY
jgi:hypothetical protein